MRASTESLALSAFPARTKPGLGTGVVSVMRFSNIFRVRESNNLEFWVSNLVIVLSTVLGVYLAAQAGYRTAVEFEAARAERESFYLRRALLEEVKDNLEQADKTADFIINKDGWRFRGNPDAYKLQSYVWETMKQQSITFQLPPEILTAVRRYNDFTAGVSASLAQGQGTAMEAAKNLQEETRKMRETTLPVMEKSIASLKERLLAKGVNLD
jgi:hypothetical protein